MYLKRYCIVDRCHAFRRDPLQGFFARIRFTSIPIVLPLRLQHPLSLIIGKLMTMRNKIEPTNNMFDKMKRLTARMLRSVLQ